MSDSTSTLTVARYQDSEKARWDTFVSGAKNATFLFYRDYMDYHRERFEDHSLLICEGGEIVALLPANLTQDGSLVSHQGLTYGGLVVSRTATLCDVLTSFQASLRYLDSEKINKLLYKRIPAFYNTLPDNEVDYALFLLEAHLCRRDCALVIPMSERLPLRKGRKSEIKKAARHGARVVQEASFASFWERVLVPRLASRYGVKPVHSAEEITLLASRFPDNIKLFSVYCSDKLLAGAVIYETPCVAHTQYIGVTDEGQGIGALDYLFGSLMDDHYRNKRFFDFGICNEQEGRALNRGLLDWKEGFGGRCYAHDFYEVATANHVKLDAVLFRNGSSHAAACARTIEE